MQSSPSTLFFLCQISTLFFLLLTPIISGQFSFDYNGCNGPTYPANSAYQSNLNVVLNSIISDTRITNGFYNFTSDRTQDPSNKVSSLAYCRGDVPLGTCRACIRGAAQQLPNACNQMEKFGYSQFCTIYVSNGSISGPVTGFQDFQLADQSLNLINITGINRTIQTLLTDLTDRAGSGNGVQKFATGYVNLTSGDNRIYGLVQCTPNLNRSGCAECVRDALRVNLPNFITSDLVYSGKIAAPSCFVQYQYGVLPFYGNLPDVPSPPPPPSQFQLPPPRRDNQRQANSLITQKVIPICVAALAAVVIVAFVWIICLRKKKRRKSRMRFSQEEIDSLDSLQFSFGVIKLATANFKDDNKLGQGGYGIVYKGVLSNGSEIAVKKLTRSSGTEGDEQFKNEILILAKLKHKNLVTLLGFCLHEEEMFLIYEVVANGSLDKFLFDPILRESMMWETRLKIINGTARGLLYLHEESRLRIIHRDLKAANILVDVEFNPKIADFGMARLFNIDQTRTITGKIVGTLGYMPPEYLFSGEVSMKLDVFSFGVLVLEIISGQKLSSMMGPENTEDLLSYVWRNWKEGTAWNVVDATLSRSFSIEILRCIHVALLCVQESAVDRPSMSSVCLMLSSYTSPLLVPSCPAFYIERESRDNVTLQGSYTSTTNSVNQISVSEFSPR